MAAAPTSPMPTPTPVDPIQALLAQFSQPQRQQQGPNMSDFAALLNPQTHHLGMSGFQLNPDGTDPSSPFNNGFFKTGASQLSPEALAASQGPTAVNQWNDPKKYPGFYGLIQQSVPRRQVDYPGIYPRQAQG